MQIKGVKFFKILCLALLITVLGGAVYVKDADADEIVRIGIMRFLNRAQGLSTQQADAITDIFTRMLSNSRTIAIVERDRLDVIGREHRLGMSGLVDTSTAVQIGRIAGCQYMLLGAVTRFDKHVAEQKFAFIRETKYDAEVTVDMRVVDVTTSEVVLSLAETGSATHTASGIELDKDMYHKESKLEGLEAEAINNAVSKLGQRIREIVADEYSQVLNVAGKEVTVNVGASSGANKNGLYKVYADGPEVLDMNGKAIGRKTIDIAIIRIAEVQNEFSVANVVKEGGNPSNIRRGDKIMPISSGEAKSLSKKMPKKRPTIGIARNLSAENVDEALKNMAAEQASKSGTSAVQSVSSSAVSQAKKSSAISSAGAAAAPTGKGVIAPKRERENKSTDPVKVIPTYGLSAGDANTRRIAHLNARSLGNKPAAYDRYVELVNSYSGDYLAAFKAGEVARALGRRDDAKTWFEKALGINPNYEPAQNALTKLNSTPASKRPSRTRRRK